MFRDRVIDSKAHQITEYDSVQEFLQSCDVPSGINTIYEGNLPIDILVSAVDSDTTIFFFHGAIEESFRLPVLSGLGISGGLKANRVFISDPSLILDEELLLSWYAGNYFQPDLQSTLTQIFHKIMQNLGSKRAVFFGGSGGGFASLYFAHHFENSLALVFNPQTNISNYTRRAVATFAEKAFDIKQSSKNPMSQTPKQLTYNLCNLYRKYTGATVAYMQNTNDKHHVAFHFAPFLEAIHIDTTLLVLDKPWKDGHTPPPKSLLSELLNLAATSGSWQRDFMDKGFQALTTETI